jgi:hypothetical protein
MSRMFSVGANISDMPILSVEQGHERTSRRSGPPREDMHNFFGLRNRNFHVMRLVRQSYTYLAVDFIRQLSRCDIPGDSPRRHTKVSTRLVPHTRSHVQSHISASPDHFACGMHIAGAYEILHCTI